jgi:hypothetical protein
MPRNYRIQTRTLSILSQISRPRGSGHERDSRALSPVRRRKAARHHTTFAVDLIFGVVLVRKVPAFVCAPCGDAWIDGPVAAKLESFVAEVHRKQTLMEVTQWEQVA